MDRLTLLKKLDVTLEEWERARTWGTIEIEIHDGSAALLRKETKEKFMTNGGCSHAPRRENRSGS